jgi:hypothetical protein
MAMMNVSGRCREMPPPDGRLTRVLKVAARYNAFVIWHPDIHIYEGKDEYFCLGGHCGGGASVANTACKSEFLHEK